MFKFIPNRIALIVLISLYYNFNINRFETTLDYFLNIEKDWMYRTEFGLAIGIQMLFWGIFAPIFGFLADNWR